jgi:hypothetical protein
MLQYLCVFLLYVYSVNKFSVLCMTFVLSATVQVVSTSNLGVWGRSFKGTDPSQYIIL